MKEGRKRGKAYRKRQKQGERMKRCKRGERREGGAIMQIDGEKWERRRSRSPCCAVG